MSVNNLPVFTFSWHVCPAHEIRPTTVEYGTAPLHHSPGCRNVIGEKHVAGLIVLELVSYNSSCNMIMHDFTWGGDREVLYFKPSVPGAAHSWRLKQGMIL